MSSCFGSAPDTGNSSALVCRYSNWSGKRSRNVSISVVLQLKRMAACWLSLTRPSRIVEPLPVSAVR